MWLETGGESEQTIDGQIGHQEDQGFLMGCEDMA